MVAKPLNCLQRLELNLIVAGAGKHVVQGASSRVSKAAVQTTELCLGKVGNSCFFLSQEEPWMSRLADDRDAGAL
jgi:hypothetical protein